ncbi:hypothetical protein PFICI_07683 [Pestalotiopsis fici W106-1]|uniref:Peptidase M20 dimerisation domain-containing protein n=1 Tax=Pestalotiopsis fici (strain W106-1 / CGMCC3.15140) TaxID=1229662 RepID=W3X2A5_PESFW|nr:uncharacterized protein PFICI_07683 [Pestalotiopsis fici W106-1]ETS80154.1 hypothetical protein PFICI_07683 [Pestalotiopsis fici W106-1]
MDISARDHIIDAIESYLDASVQITQALVREDSSNPPGDVCAIATTALQVIRECIPTAEMTTYQTAPHVRNVVAVIKGTADGPGRRLLFSGHLDAYPFVPEQWSMPPLGGSLNDQGTRLYGRGSSDMKGGIAASIVAASVLSKFSDKWSGEVVIALAGDEETMGSLGSAYLLEHVEPVRQADAVICGDAGSPSVVRIGEKGLVWLEVTAEGVACHGAHVHRGKNAIERLMEALMVLKDLEKLQTEAPDEVEQVMADAKPISEPLGGAGEWETLQRVTVNIGKISGGVSANLVPDNAQASIDIRLPIGVSAATLLEAVQSRLQRLEGISFQVVQKYDATWTNPSEKIVQDVCKVVEDMVPTETTINNRVGASDTRLFRAKNIPSVVVGLTPNNMGGPDEYIEVAELHQLCHIHTLAAWQFLTT